MSWTTADTLARTVTFQEVLHDAAVDVSMLPDTDALDHGTAAQLTRGINAAYRYAWEYYNWPESTVIDTLACNAHPVYINGKFIPRQTAAGLRIATLFGLWTAHPLDDPTEASPVCWSLGPDGFYLPCHDADTVVAEYRTDVVRFDSREWDEEPIYPMGTIRYHAADGNSYRSTVGTKGVIPGIIGQLGVLHDATLTQPAYYEVTEDGSTAMPQDAWVAQPLLWILAEAVKAGASAMYARAEGQYGTSTLLEGAMMHLLDAQILQNDTQMGQSKSYRRSRTG